MSHALVSCKTFIQTETQQTRSVMSRDSHWTFSGNARIGNRKKSRNEADFVIQIFVVVPYQPFDKDW